MKTTAGGKEIQIYGTNDISEAYSNTVHAYLNKGYMFNYDNTPREHQGENMSAYLTQDGGKTVIAVFIGKFTEFDEGMRTDGVHVFTREYKDADKKDTLWMDKGELMSDIKFYKIRGRKDIFVDNLNDCKAIRKIQRRREEIKLRLWDLKQERNLPRSTYKAALKLVKKQKGHKSAMLPDIKKVVRQSKSISVYFKNGCLNISHIAH